MTSADHPATPDEAIPQDPGIPGWDVVSDPRAAPIPDEKDPGSEERERLDDPDYEGEMAESPPVSPGESEP